MKLLSVLTVFALCLCALQARAALVLNVNGPAGTMEWVSGQTTFTAAADLSFLFGSGVGNTIRFTAPEPERTKDFDNPSGMIMEIYTNVSETAIVGIRLYVGGTIDSSDGSLIGNSPGATTPVFGSGYSFASFGDVPSDTYILAALPESDPNWDAPVQINYTAVPEPSTYAMILALAGLSFAYWRRRQ